MPATGRLLTVILFLCTTLSTTPAAAAPKNVIITYHQPPGQTERAFLQSQGGKIKHQYRLIKATAASLPEAAIEKLKRHPKVRMIEEDLPVALIEATAEEIEYDNAWGVTRIGALLLHNQGWFGQGIRIAVFDTGIDYNHPELTASFRGGVNLVNPNSTDPMDDSWNGHGTHVAGILAAVGNGAGVVGVAPGAELYAVKVLDRSGFGTTSSLIAGLEWAVANRMAIANLSLGTAHPSTALEAACQAAQAAGLLVVAAAGNTGDSGGEILYPARYESVLAVSATANDDSTVWTSAAGPEVELAAPGGNIFSTLPGGAYGLLTGTSQAAPHVSGVAALLLAVEVGDLDGDERVSAREMRQYLQLSALDLGEPGKDDHYGYGLVQAGSEPAPGTMHADLVPREKKTGNGKPHGKRPGRNK